MALVAFGPKETPAPISPNLGAASYNITGTPFDIRQSVTMRPPIPPPTTATLKGLLGGRLNSVGGDIFEQQQM